MPSENDNLRWLVAGLGVVLFSLVWVALPQVRGNGLPQPVSVTAPTPFPPGYPGLSPAPSASPLPGYPYPGPLPTTLPLPPPMTPTPYPPGYFANLPTAVPPTSYPGAATPVPTLNAAQSTDQAATWQAFEATGIAANTASVQALKITLTPMPPGEYIDPFGRFTSALPVGWRAPTVFDPTVDTFFYNFTAEQGRTEDVPAGGVTVQIGFSTLPPGQTFEPWVVTHVQQWAVSNQGNATYGDARTYALGGYAGYATDWASSAGSGRYIFLPVGAHGVAQILIFPADPDVLGPALELLSTLKLIDPPAE